MSTPVQEAATPVLRRSTRTNKKTDFPLSDDDFPALPGSPATPPLPSPPTSSPAPATHQPRLVCGPNITRHKDKSRWHIPDIQSEVVILGDSNLSRVTKVPNSVNSIEIHSYPGAKPFHLLHLMSNSPKPQAKPTTVILSIGINSRDNRSTTHQGQIKSLVSSSSKFFPNAQIFIPQINYSSSLKQTQRASLDSLNKIIEEFAGDSSPIKTITKLPSHLFHIDPKDNYGIHWTTNTADQQVKHWLSHLN